LPRKKEASGPAITDIKSTLNKRKSSKMSGGIECMKNFTCLVVGSRMGAIMM
jgi:hypothetical protein